MKNRRFRKLLLLPFVLSIGFSLTSCAFFDDGSGTEIKSVVPTYDDKTGNTIITITFVDEDIQPVTFLIPRGLSGKDGVSIKDITSKMLADNKTIELTISYSDPSVQDTVLSVPVLEGKGVREVNVETDEEGNTTFQFTYTDNTKGPIIQVPKGKDGNGIESFDVSDPDSNGIMVATVKFTDGTEKTFEIKNGKDGVSVATIEYDAEKSDDSHYVLKVTYSDTYTETITLDRPKSTIWYTGTIAPDKESAALSKANVGDFYLNRLNGYVYQLESDGTWNFLFGMKSDGTSSGEEVYHTVFFDPGEGKINDIKGTVMSDVLEGHTLSLNRIPLPVYDGHAFEGWYTDINNVNSGNFTDMVPVYSDLKLFAKYSVI